MKKFSAAGTLVAASAALAVIGFGAPAIASASSAAHVVRSVLPGQVLTPASGLVPMALGAARANKCDGDHDSDDVGCGSTFVNKCDGDHDSDDVSCGGGASANRCDGDGDSDDVSCGGGASANRCDGDGDSDDWSCGANGANNHGVRPHRYHSNTGSYSSSYTSAGDYRSGEHFHGLVRFVDSLKDSILGLL
jgi:hypothetical protein